MTQLTKYLEIFEFGGLAGWINMFEHISLVLGVSQDGEGKLSTAPNAAQDSSSNLGKIQPLLVTGTLRFNIMRIFIHRRYF